MAFGLGARFFGDLTTAAQRLHLMKLPSHALILGEGDDVAWRKLSQHADSFIFAAWDEAHHLVSLHQLTWTGARKPSSTPTGIIGWVRCHQNAGTGDPLPLAQGVLLVDPVLPLFSPVCSGLWVRLQLLGEFDGVPASRFEPERPNLSYFTKCT